MENDSRLPNNYTINPYSISLIRACRDYGFDPFEEREEFHALPEPSSPEGLLKKLVEV